MVKQPKRFIEQQVRPSYYRLEPFPEGIVVEEKFFDHDRRVHGVIRCTNPHRYGRIDQVANEHLTALLRTRADDRSHLPETVGYSDDTPSGRVLQDTLTGRRISDLRKHQAALGMLTSDGLTTISKSGHVLECGQIIRIAGTDSPGGHVGGGRTLAAVDASRYGLVIKISQDGPISFYRNGAEHIRIVF